MTRPSYSITSNIQTTTAPGAALGIALLLSACSETNTKEANAPSADVKHPLVGQEAPEFNLKAEVGSKKVSPSDYSGKVVIVDFWATWCGPCRESFPAYERLVQDHDGVIVLGVSVDDEPEGIPDFVAETKVHFPIGWDKDQRVSGLYKPPAMPTSFMIDTNGIVRHVHTGYHAADEPVIAREADALAE